MNAHESLGGNESPMEMEQALDTLMPDHKLLSDPVNLGTVRSASGRDIPIVAVPVIIPCKGLYPEYVDVTADGKLVTSCGRCGQSYVWVQTKHSWGAT